MSAASWRETSLASFRTAEPAWRTLLDVDALAAAEGRNWVYQGATVLPPGYRHALLSLSDGGKDAHEVREFDLADLRFVDAGFRLPEGKQSAQWLDPDTLIVGRDWGPGTMTESGYPFVLKTWHRGAPLDAAVEMFRGNEDDVSVSAGVLRDPDGTVRGVLINRQLNFFESERYLVTPGGPLRLPLPAKSSFRGFVAGQLVFSLEEDWGADFATGALVSLDLAACLAGPQRARPVLVLCAGAARGDRGCRHHPQPAAGDDLPQRPGQRRRLPLRGRRLAARSRSRCRRRPRCMSSRRATATTGAFVDVAGFLIPNTLYLAEPGAAAPVPVKSLPPRFDAAGGIVEQFEAASQDGTAVPYFVVRPRDHAVRRVEPDPALRLWRVPGVDDPRLCADRSASCGWSRAASTSSPISAAAASSGRNGTRPR